MPAHAQGELDAAREEPIGSVNELMVLVDKTEPFKEPGGVAPVSDAFAKLTDSGNATLGGFLDMFTVTEINRRRAEIDPEFDAEQRAAAARELVAAKRAEEAEKKEKEVHNSPRHFASCAAMPSHPF